jgi:16S rRNA (cytosine967-C5)-methyltransferase
LLPRAEAVRILHSVLSRGAPLDETFHASVSRGVLAKAAPRDRRLCYAIIATSLRRKGQIERELGILLSKPLPKSSGLTREILVATAAQILFMRIPSHAAVAQAVEIAKADPRAKHFAALVNAIGRKLSAAPPGEETPEDLSINTPAWLYARWSASYGASIAREIAKSHLWEPPLDLTVKKDPEAWAERLGGRHVPPQTVRLDDWQGAISDLPGFSEGQWWVQDEAAAIPARLLGPVEGKMVLDLCAAPGGKTAQLASFGAHVTAVDRSPSRVAKLRENLERLRLSAELVVSDVLDYRPSQLFDAVILDAPCSATGIIRRHPDLPYHRTPEMITALAALQLQLLEKAVSFMKPGGIMVFCTCSLEPEEGEHHLRTLPPDSRHLPLKAQNDSLKTEWLSTDLCLRTLPNQELDGFFAMLLERL